MSISEAEMKELLDNQRLIIKQNEELRQKNAELTALVTPDAGSTSRVLRQVTDRYVEVRLVDGKVVLGYQNVGSETRPSYIYQKPDPKDPKQMLDYVNLILEGEEKPFSIDYKQFRTESDQARCKVVESKEIPWRITQGMVKKKEVDGYSTIEVDFDVPLDVLGVTRLFVVEIPKDHGGPRNVKIQEGFVNIA
jgi:hypothetical protein